MLLNGDLCNWWMGNRGAGAISCSTAWWSSGGSWLWCWYPTLKISSASRPREGRFPILLQVSAGDRSAKWPTSCPQSQLCLRGLNLSSSQIKVGSCSEKFFVSKSSTFRTLEITQLYRAGLSNNCINEIICTCIYCLKLYVFPHKNFLNQFFVKKSS